MWGNRVDVGHGGLQNFSLTSPCTGNKRPNPAYEVGPLERKSLMGCQIHVAVSAVVADEAKTYSALRRKGLRRAHEDVSVFGIPFALSNGVHRQRLGLQEECAGCWKLGRL
jgi:hypothetical protein